jgi:hypothetical protein
MGGQVNGSLTIIGLTVILLVATCGPSLGGEAWKGVPLWTAAQKRAGFAGGEMGQMGFCLAISKKDPRRLAMSLDTAGIYVSLDAGATWQVRRSGLRSNGANSVAFDPENADVLYAAGNKNLPSDDPYDPIADGIYRSSDLGVTWQRVFQAGFRRSAGQNEYFAFADPSGGVSRTIWAHTTRVSSGVAMAAQRGQPRRPRPAASAAASCAIPTVAPCGSRRAADSGAAATPARRGRGWLAACPPEP